MNVCVFLLSFGVQLFMPYFIKFHISVREFTVGLTLPDANFMLIGYGVSETTHIRVPDWKNLKKCGHRDTVQFFDTGKGKRDTTHVLIYKYN